MLKYGREYNSAIGDILAVSDACKKFGGTIDDLNIENGVVCEVISAYSFDEVDKKEVVDYEKQYQIFKLLIEEGIEPIDVTKDTLEYLLSKKERVTAVKDMYNDAVLNAPMDTPDDTVEEYEEKYKHYSKILNCIYRLAKG